MAERVWKFTLGVDTTTVEMPGGATVLACQMQRGEICLWAECSDDPSRYKEFRTFRVYGTDHPLDVQRRHSYIGTVQMCGGDLIFHVYEILN